MGLPGYLAVFAVGSGVAGVAVRVALSEERFTKRALDVLLGSVALILSLPLLAVCAVIIKLSSRGPVLLRQQRVGKGGSRFTLYKLRTMRAEAESGSRAVWAGDQDPRVVRTCRWMRRSHVDELLQLINVLRGEMSLVGPRPEREEILSALAGRYPHIRRRLAVRPGITGLAQIRWGYDTTPARFVRKFRADMEYIERQSVFLDLWILLATVPKFVDGRTK